MLQHLFVLALHMIICCQSEVDKIRSDIFGPLAPGLPGQRDFTAAVWGRIWTSHREREMKEVLGAFINRHEHPGRRNTRRRHACELAGLLQDAEPRAAGMGRAAWLA